MKKIPQSTSSEASAVAWISSARSLVYCVLALVFDSESDDRLRSLSESPEVRQAFDMLCGEKGSELLESLNDLDRFEYASLFVGPGRVAAPPWESHYRSKDGLVMGQTTLSVAESYQAAGYKSTGHGHIPDDHIATELLFMAFLCRDEGTEPQQISFLENHLGAWIDSFAKRIAEANISDTYAAAAAIAADFVRQDRSLIVELAAAHQPREEGDLQQ